MEIYCYKDIEITSIDELIQKISEIASEVSGYEKVRIFQHLTERERLSPTAIGKGILLPHIRLENLKSDYLFFFKIKNGLRYKTPDEKDIKLVFLILSPFDRKTEYLRLVSSIVKMINNDAIYNQISTNTDTDELKRLFLVNLFIKGRPD